MRVIAQLNPLNRAKPRRLSPGDSFETTQFDASPWNETCTTFNKGVAICVNFTGFLNY